MEGSRRARAGLCKYSLFYQQAKRTVGNKLGLRPAVATAEDGELCSNVTVSESGVTVSESG